jgi:hypothetical protein
MSTSINIRYRNLLNGQDLTPKFTTSTPYTLLAPTFTTGGSSPITYQYLFSNENGNISNAGSATNSGYASFWFISLPLPNGVAVYGFDPTQDSPVVTGITVTPANTSQPYTCSTPYTIATAQTGASVVMSAGTGTFKSWFDTMVGSSSGVPAEKVSQNETDILLLVCTNASTPQNPCLVVGSINSAYSDSLMYQAFCITTLMVAEWSEDLTRCYGGGGISEAVYQQTAAKLAAIRVCDPGPRP